MADESKDAAPVDGPLEGNIRNILQERSLKWIFVGGKGGVGKTTTSCSLAVALAQCRESVLIISTDPAHNLSDAFGQKFGKQPTRVHGFDNLAAMEIDPTVEIETLDVLDSKTQSLMAELTSAVPGIDEAMSFGEIMKQVQSYQYDTVVFDTAPTGHTLRLLNFPSLLQKGLSKLLEIRNRFSGLLSHVQQMMEQYGTTEEEMLSKVQHIKSVIEDVHGQFKNPALTTFICVCIPEFLSLFETERLVQELMKFEIDTHNIIVNQVLMPEKGSQCAKCTARVRMQKKYLDQIKALYGDDFHVTVMPLLDEEVRGKDKLLQFAAMLQDPPKPSN